MEQPLSSSKVTVEYFDPHGVYQLLSPGLLPRLPLKNLHWESHAGPLRSISTLHIDLVASSHSASDASSSDPRSLSISDLSRVKSNDSSVGEDGFQTQNLGNPSLQRNDSDSKAKGPERVKGRRHQIPGLRQTPYLKVYFLRCDDNDTYKAQSRKEVREWIKEHTPPSTAKVNSQENHDAYEWLIIHVIVPNTAAATQPRSSGKNAEAIAEKATARWRGGGSTTILEKLRADFNGSSKSSIDRIAQIRIGVNDVPYEMLPRVVPAIPGSYTESAQDNENAWLDLITKFKFLILASFDMRVSQYEEDIREKDAQRRLPGWNFCTFFVLKEGLARGFENVGLVEDALVGYDELSVGLDTVIRDEASAGTTSFLPFTDDIKRRFDKVKSAILKESGSDTAEEEESIDLQSSGQAADTEDYEIPLHATKKRYRELILSNDVSVFDFRCYLFARQLSLLLRLANATSSQEELLAKLKEQRESSLQGVAARNPPSKPTEDVENLATLGEVCRRSMNFVASISSILREDLLASRKANRTAEDPKDDDPVTTQIIENIVISFSFAITQQILAQTSTKSLPIPPSTLAPPSSQIGLDGQEPKAAIPEPKTMMHPARTTSLYLRSSAAREPPSPGLFPGMRRASLPDEKATSSSFLKPGLENLAAHRAELYLLSRNLLERVGKERGWSVGWSEVEHLQEDTADMEEVNLDEEHSAPGGESITHRVPQSLHGIDNKLLRTGLDNQEDFYRLYETLTDKALRHYTVASHTESVQTRMADLAILKYHLKDYAAAASYFYRMTTFYSEGGWTQIEVSMLKMYARCLKELQRKEDYVRVLLRLLAKAAETEKERLKHKSALKLSSISSIGQEPEEAEYYLKELLELTKELQHEVQVPLQNFFGRVEVDDAPRYFEDRDSISLQLRLQYLLSEDLNIDKTRVCLKAVTGEGREIWLESDGAVLCKNGFVKVQVQTNTIIPGAYFVSNITLQASEIILQYSHEEKAGIPFIKGDLFFKSSKLLIYHRTEALDVQLFASRYLHLDRNRSLEVEISSGWNNVTSGELLVRPATAGLRLQTSEVSILNGTLDVTKKTEPGVIKFGTLQSDSRVKLRMPFNLEHDVQEISMKLEMSYTTEKGTFFYSTTSIISIALPLGVNVQDVFKHKALFSRFTISSSTDRPLRLLSSTLEKSDVFEAESGIDIEKPIMVFPRQPANILYKITRSLPKASFPPSPTTRKHLSLVLHYICLDEEIDQAVTQSLTQAFDNTPLYHYARLVLPTVLDQFRSNLTPYDLEKTAVLNEISTSILRSVRWQDYFAGLGRSPDQEQDVATLLAQKLQQWQKDSPAISLLPVSLDPETVAKSRSIVIPVDVPSVTVVHTADLKILAKSSVVANTAVAAMNQPVPAALHLKWTTTWNTDSIVTDRRPSRIDNTGLTQPEQMEFVYEVSAASDTWLIGGRRRGHFKVSSSSQSQTTKQTFPIVLIPLREGFLPFPTVEIHYVAPPKPVVRSSTGHPGTSDAATTEPKYIVTSETDFKNVGETIRVVSDARKTTVSLDASGPQGGAWLLESERRGGGYVIG
ncbi:hypothetical protein BP6252_05384 [Coleophoma cylindrospora]|uniref:TMEM1 family protein-like protein n=1 Tax=Coleophoma cylindrospora TaxID=1849047 RepID=A0A3D8RU59_9HELO|nr:hypothetical protein BP6252_05384 [Coleophoma cylindrospora]